MKAIYIQYYPYTLPEKCCHKGRWPCLLLNPDKHGIQAQHTSHTITLAAPLLSKSFSVKRRRNERIFLRQIVKNLFFQNKCHSTVHIEVGSFFKWLIIASLVLIRINHCMGCFILTLLSEGGT